MIHRATALRRTRAIAIALVLVGCAGAPSAAPSAAPSVPATLAVPTATPLQPSILPPTVEPTGDPSSPAIAWEPGGAFQMDGDLVGMAAGPQGYVVLALPRTAWFSTDGETWTSATLPFDGGVSNGVELRAHANEVVAGPAGFLVVGGYDHGPCSASQGAGGPPQCDVSPIAWVSSDGITWRSTESQPLPSDGSDLPAYSEMVHAWSVGSGWDAAVEARDSVRYHGNTLLHSPDGLAWSRLEAAPLPSGAASGDAVSAHAGVGTGDSRRLVWQVLDDLDWVASPPQSTLATSSDGQSWEPISGFDGDGVIVRLGLGPDAGSDRWLILGDMVDGDQLGTRSWVSDDLVAWRGSDVDGPLARATPLSSVARWRGGYIVHGGDEDVPGIGIWLSPDGLVWTEVVGSTPAASDMPEFFATGPAGLLGVGEFDYRAQAWRAAAS